jgi:hypothetical protein
MIRNFLTKNGKSSDSLFPIIISDHIMGQADTEAIGNVINKATLYRYISKPNDLIMTVKEALSKYQADMQELEIKIAERTAELQKKNEDLTDSINYAKRIQNAMLPFPDRIAQSLGEDYFILFKPKDIVSGDFYWFQDMSIENYDLGITNRILNSEKENKIIIVAADCTGHGVPGAFMSMLAARLTEKKRTKNTKNFYLCTISSN